MKYENLLEEIKKRIVKEVDYRTGINIHIKEDGNFYALSRSYYLYLAEEEKIKLLEKMLNDFSDSCINLNDKCQIDLESVLTKATFKSWFNKLVLANPTEKQFSSLFKKIFFRKSLADILEFIPDNNEKIAKFVLDNNNIKHYNSFSTYYDFAQLARFNFKEEDLEKILQDYLFTNKDSFEIRGVNAVKNQENLLSFLKSKLPQDKWLNYIDYLCFYKDKLLPTVEESSLFIDSKKTCLTFNTLYLSQKYSSFLDQKDINLAMFNISIFFNQTKVLGIDKVISLKGEEHTYVLEHTTDIDVPKIKEFISELISVYALEYDANKKPNNQALLNTVNASLLKKKLDSQLGTNEGNVKKFKL